MNQKAVVAGATGLVGKELVHLLLINPAYTAVTLIVRRPTGIAHPKLQEKIVDFNRLEQSDVDLAGADVFCALGTTIKKAGSQKAFRLVDYEYPLALGRMAKAQGAKQFLIITSMGANPASRTFYIRVKGEVEKELLGLGLSALHIFRPSLLLGNREEFRFGERISAVLSSILSPLFLGTLKKYKPVHAETVAGAMIRIAQKGTSGIHVYESNQIVQA
ncbi:MULTISPECIES: oxidoreductase [Neobacillus]|uniref:Oxidoreductase n=1 Tax=Neobacillus rhizophilus TaxID=2833579 RepID=A0A942YXA1_9BACI|nr:MULTISPECIES: oxidoreductase [Neobacillus]MBS4213586.1 oxidoreductase [Neobacillus rhizophilus]MBU8918006.1 oxidoreductase [Bacillus sp. FJAT-29953]